MLVHCCSYALLLLLLTTAAQAQDDSAAVASAQAWVDAAPTPLPDVVQSSALATFYYATNGADWIDNSNWLSYSVQDCQWYNQADPSCSNSGNSKQITDLILKDNNLGGSIPAAIGALSLLEEFDLDGNNVGGPLPSTLGLLANTLEELNLRENQITGPLVTELGLLVNLDHLFLDTNEISGSLPPQMGSMVKLEDLEISNNQLEGSIPDTFQNLLDLESLELYNNKRLNGTLPVNLLALPNLEYFSVYFNYFTGPIPTSIGLSSTLEELWLKDNYFTGVIPSEIGLVATMKEIRLDDNRLTGTIPTTMGLLVNLVELQLDENEDLAGPIPTELGNCASLGEIVLRETAITGTVPTQLARLVNLTRLDVNQTKMTGQIPSALCNVVVFDCEATALCGCGCACAPGAAPAPGAGAAPAPAPAPAPVPAPETSGGGLDVCFSEDMTVLMRGRTTMERTKMRDLQVGDSILTSADGEFSTVYGFGHRNPTRPAEFLKSWTNNGSPLELTAAHLVFTSGQKKHPVRADSLRVGDALAGLEGPRTIVRMERIHKTGIYAPLTNQGTLVVNGIVSSSYVSLEEQSNTISFLQVSYHDLIHVAVAPYRFLCGLKLTSTRDNHYNADGMPHYVAFGLGLLRWVLAQHWILQCVMTVLILAATGLVFALEMALGMNPALLAGALVVARRLYNKKSA